MLRRTQDMYHCFSEAMSELKSVRQSGNIQLNLLILEQSSGHVTVLGCRIVNHTSRQELHDEVEVHLVLETVEHFYYP